MQHLHQVLLIFVLLLGQTGLLAHQADTLAHTQDDSGCELCLLATPLDNLVSVKPALTTPPTRFVTPLFTTVSVIPQLDVTPFSARAPPSGLF